MAEGVCARRSCNFRNAVPFANAASTRPAAPPSPQNGVVLCKALNAIKPKTVKKSAMKPSTMPFKQMEVIKAYLQGCRSLGMAEHDVFCTPDLFEEKDLGAVVRSIVALSSTAQTKVPEFSGPTLGVKQSTADAREGKEWHGKEFGTGGVVPKLMQGSSGTMEKQGPSVRAREVAGFEASGAGSSVATKAMMGSRGTMEKQGPSVRAREGAGHEASGSGSSVATKAMMGSRGTMAATKGTDTTSPTFGADAVAGKHK